MPIELITGPANAGKARLVMEALRGLQARGEDPLLVVPTRADADHYRLELAAGGALLGARVERFEGLARELVGRAGVGVQPLLHPLARERVLAALAARAGAGIGGGQSPGLQRALCAFVAELQARRVTPERLRRAIAAWTAAGTADRHAEALWEVFDGYQRTLARIGRTDPELRTARALDALRREPALWGATPVLFYGFDDLTPLELDAIETLGRVVDAPVTVSLAYEPLRLAFAGRAEAFQTLLPLVASHRQLPSRADHYEPAAGPALHHLERRLFEPGGERMPAGGALRLLEGAGERAELELVAGEIRALLDRGLPAGEIALVHRSPGPLAGLIAEVLRAFEIPHSLQRRIPFAHTAVGGALLGGLRVALLGDRALLADLLAWLRCPGLLTHPELADALEASARRNGVQSAAEALVAWEAQHWPLDALERLATAAARSMAALIEQTTQELQRLFAAPRRNAAALLGADEIDEARALAAGRQALAGLAELARADQDLVGGPDELLQALERLEIVSGEPPGPDAVAVLDPLALRARRVRALFLCGMQEGVFPAAARPQPLLGDEQRRRLAEASGLRLGGHEDPLQAERYLLYATVSRPTELLVLSWHTAADDGSPAAPSLFLDDIRDLFDVLLGDERRRRALGALDWPGPGPVEGQRRRREAIRAAPRRRPPALRPLRDERLLAELDERRLWSASSLETWAGCPARWLVERLLRPEPFDPEAEPLARGSLAHAALKDTLAGLRDRVATGLSPTTVSAPLADEQAGSARLTPAVLPAARELLREALARHGREIRLSTSPERVPGASRRLRVDLERYLEHACAQQSPLEPTHLELSFGFPGEDGELPPCDLGQQVLMRGRIDRVDVGPDGSAVVYDYKATRAPRAEVWLQDRRLQVGLYMHAVEQLLDRRAVGGFYQPLSGRDLRARGLLAADAGVELASVAADLRERPDFDALLADILTAARTAAGQARAGALQARPETCGFAGGCQHPTICRCER